MAWQPSFCSADDVPASRLCINMDAERTHILRWEHAVKSVGTARRPLLDALGEGYDAHAEGTGFYALQSCANHSCQPNAHTLKVQIGNSTLGICIAAPHSDCSSTPSLRTALRNVLYPYSSLGSEKPGHLIIGSDSLLWQGDGDVTGDAVVTATAAIPTGTEITISYIDVELPLNERQVRTSI